MAAAMRMISVSSVEFTVTTFVTRGLPSVIVPVLSTASARSLPMASRTAPPLMSTPRRAIAVRPETMETGVEMTSAHGQAMTSSTRAR